MLLEESHQRLVPALILASHPVIRQIATGGHKSVDLVAKCLHLAQDLQRFLKRFDRLRVLVLRGKKAQGHGDVGSVGRVDHRRVSFGRGGEFTVRAGGVGYDLHGRKELALVKVLLQV